MGLITEEQLSAATSPPSRLPRLLYVAVVATGLLLTVGQLGVMPRFLSPEEFGVVVIAISVTQGFFQFADIGFGRLSDETLRAKDQRDHLRMLSFTSATVALIVVVLLGGIVYLISALDFALYAVIAAATAWVLYPTQLRAQACEARGDEVGSTLRHLLWQNAPKVGLVAGALITGSAPGCLLGGLAGACLVSAPKACSLLSAREIPGLWRRWLPSLLAILAPFVMAWSDTYFVAAHHGLRATAGYALVYRILASVSYLYLPFGSVLLSRWNRRECDAAWQVPVVSLSLCVPVLVILAVGIVAWGERLFPGVPISIGIVAPLVVMNVLACVSYLVGTTLSALGQFRSILVANLVGAMVALGGHLAYTLRSSIAVAAVVSCLAVATTAALQVLFAVSAWRSNSCVPATVTTHAPPPPVGPATTI